MDHSAEGPVVAWRSYPFWIICLAVSSSSWPATTHSPSPPMARPSSCNATTRRREYVVLPEGHCVFVDARTDDRLCLQPRDSDQIDPRSQHDLTISVSPSRDPSAVIQRARDRVFRPLGEGELDPYNR